MNNNNPRGKRQSPSKKRPTNSISSLKTSSGQGSQKLDIIRVRQELERRKKQRSKITALMVAMLTLVLILIIVLVAKCGSDNYVDPNNLPYLTAAVTDLGETTAARASFPEPDTIDDRFGCSYIYLEELDSGRPIAEKAADELAYPASLTKIMTAVVVLENVTDLESEITLDAEMFDYIMRNSAATAGYEPGEKVKAIDMLYGLLLPSGAECAIGLAQYVAGSETAFVQMMNQKAADLGLVNTHFVNSTGLHDLNHYTTAYDMARLLTYALENNRFRQIFTTVEYFASPTELHLDGITMNHTVFRAFRQIGYDYGYVTGGKTGYTDQAGQCMAILAEKDDVEYILIVMGAGDGTNSDNFHVKSVDGILKEFLG